MSTNRSDGGIRTHGTLSRPLEYQSSAIGHSATSPDSPLNEGGDVQVSSERGRVRLTDGDRERIERLRAEGVPASWIAEDFGVHTHTIQAMTPADPVEVAAWRSDFQHIRKDPELFALHCEFAPAKRGRA